MMKIQQLSLYALTLTLSLSSFAGNEDRIGQAGAQHLLINPWGRTSGLGNGGTATVSGIESMYSNIAGTLHTTNMELGFTSTNWLVGSGIKLNAFGFTKKFNSDAGASAFSLGATSMNYGDILVTTVEQPEGGIGNLSLSSMSVNLGYSRKFGNRIYSGMQVKLISEGVSNARATGVALDAGIQYWAGTNDNLMLGVTLKNIGPKMKYSGDGLSFKTNTPSNSNYQATAESRTEGFDLPTVLHIGLAYRLDFDEKMDNSLTFAGDFMANSFGNDQISLGLEYKYKSLLALRGAFVYEKGIFSSTETVTALSGPVGGLSFNVPLGKKTNEKRMNLAIDGSYRATNVFSGVYSIGARLNF